jgi:hypothetical protein
MVNRLLCLLINDARECNDLCQKPATTTSCSYAHAILGGKESHFGGKEITFTALQVGAMDV